MNSAHAEHSRLNGHRSIAAYWSVFGLGFLWALQLCVRSSGTITDDEIGHYLLSHSAFRFPENLLDLWGRPFNTLVYAIPALGGLEAARIFSLTLSVATVLVATRLAAVLGVRYLFLVPAFLWFQPWFTDIGYSVLTEIPFSLCLTAGTFFWATERYGIASAFIGLLPLTRHEGVALTGLWFLYMVLMNNWRAATVAVFPLVAFNAIALFVQGVPTYLLYSQPRPTSFYGRGDWFHFVRSLRSDVGAPILLLTGIGLWPICRLEGRRLVAGFALYFALHVVIYRFGLFASGGYGFFLLPLAPAFAIAAAAGFEWSVETAREVEEWVRQRVSPRLNVVPLSAGLAVVITIAYGLRTQPRPLSHEGVSLRQASTWLREQGLDSRQVVATNVNFYYFHDLPVGPGSYWWIAPKPASLAPGTIAVWDRHYSNRFGLSLEELTETGGWHKLASFGPAEFAIVFEKQDAPILTERRGATAR